VKQSDLANVYNKYVLDKFFCSFLIFIYNFCNSLFLYLFIKPVAGVRSARRAVPSKNTGPGGYT
jgi:hypothetical protein